MNFTTALLAAVCALSQANAKPEESTLSLFPSGYLDADALTAALRQRAEGHPETVQLRSLAKTAEGRDVWLVTLGRSKTEGQPPALLIVANMEADHLIGGQVALGLIDRLLDTAGREGAIKTFLDTHRVYVVPRLNPDGAERVIKTRLELRTNLRPIDRDRDGRSGEDGPDDLNGDGLATRMRVKDGRATLVLDEKEPRILRKADAGKGERGVYSEYLEGIDNDDDGRLNEDPVGGVNLNRNWPHRWTEFDREAGASPVSEPEVQALIQFAFDHPEIAVIWSFGLDDNLRAEPKKPESKLDDADLPYFAELARRYSKALAPPEKKEEKKEEKKDEAKDKEEKKDETKDKGAQETAPKKEPTNAPASDKPAESSLPKGYDPILGSSASLDATTDGSLSEWAYHQYGVVGLASRLWDKPPIPEPAQGQSKPPDGGEPRWLYWNDHVMGGRAFVPFAPFDHPILGRVEIGGWRPGVRLNPPIEQVGPLVEAHFTFLKDLTQRFAALGVPEVKVEAKGGGLFEVTAVVQNTGYLPTALAQGVKTHKADPVLVRLRTDKAKLLTGKPLERINSLPGSGSRRTYRWLVSAPEDVKTITLEVSCPKAGRITRAIELR
jgi:Zinc carboxypeptidase